MAPLFPHTCFGPKFEHDNMVDIVMGNVESLSTYLHYRKSSLVPHILSGKLACYFKLAQGWICHQAEFKHSGLGVSTNWVHSLMIFTPPNMLLHPGSYSKVPKKPWKPMLDSVNTVNF